MIYRGFSALRHAYHELASGDVFVGQMPSSALRPVMMADLAARGVTLIPSAIAQLLHASKVAQAQVLGPWMLAHTIAVTRRKTLLDALDLYRQKGITVAVTKEDRLHCGHGVRKWADLELLYSCLGLNEKAFPFVLQPFVGSFTDIRIIWVGDFSEAYRREHQSSFRKNLAGGGRSVPCELTPRQRRFCRELMERSQMPYAHIDLMVSGEDECYLSEIRMNGGIHGAKITRQQLNQMKQERLDALAGAE